MRPLVLALAALAIVALLPTPAAAQQQGSLTITLQAPDVLTPDSTVTFAGTVTMVVDYTAALQLSGIPVVYAVENAPSWATVTISPASDVFPPPSGAVPAGFAYTVTKSFIVTVSASEGPGMDAIESLTLGAWTQPGAFGNPMWSQGMTVVTFDAPDPTDEECEHGLTDAQIAALKSEAIATYNDMQAAKAEDEASDDVTVQNSTVSPVTMSTMAIAGFAIVGAGVGLLLRRRLKG